MITQQEQSFIKKYIVREKQERYLAFLSHAQNRRKFIEALYHFTDFKWELMQEIKGPDETHAIVDKLKSYEHIINCSVISTDTNYDGKLLPVREAIQKVVGIEGSILIFGAAEVIYYEGEAPKRRYISV
ncbi:hypothetical protein [Hymenobacter koreensis]